MGKKKPTPEELVAMETKGAVKASYLSEAAWPEGKDGIAFDYQVVDDEKILMLFEPYLGTTSDGALIKNPNYTPLLKPLLPYVSRLCYLTSCSELDAEIFKCRADYQITLLKARAETDEEYDLLEALKAWIEIRINDSIKGAKMKMLTERKRTVRFEEMKEKKRWLR